MRYSFGVHIAEDPTLAPRPGFDDAAARFALAALNGPYLPWGPGTMRPTGLVAVCNDVVLNRRRRIVELGSGVSTVLLARLLTSQAPTGGFRVAAVEHDPRWAEWVRSQLAREGIGTESSASGTSINTESSASGTSIDTESSASGTSIGTGVTVVHAPLAAHPLAVGGLAWYEPTALETGLDTALRGDPVDLLLVDGPPAWQDGHGLARYPALGALRHRLAPGATVMLDDVERPGEREVLRRWERETGLAFARADTGLAVATFPG
ncbi:MAG: class I SAM-dependent methyltransferase [Pseudonocardia sp.]